MDPNNMNTGSAILLNFLLAIISRYINFEIKIKLNHTESTLSFIFFFFSSRRRHTRFKCDWSSDVCSSDLATLLLSQDGRSGGRSATPGSTGQGSPACAMPTGSARERSKVARTISGRVMIMRAVRCSRIESTVRRIYRQAFRRRRCALRSVRVIIAVTQAAIPGVAVLAWTAVPINFIRLSTGELIAPATAETNNRRADVIWGAPGDAPRAASSTGWRWRAAAAVEQPRPEVDGASLLAVSYDPLRHGLFESGRRARRDGRAGVPAARAGGGGPPRVGVGARPPPATPPAGRGRAALPAPATFFQAARGRGARRHPGAGAGGGHPEPQGQYARQG